MTLSQEDITAAAEHVLRLDDGTARRAAIRRIAVDPEFREAVAEWEASLAPLIDDVPEVAPPRRVRRRLRRRLFGAPTPPWRRVAAGLMAGLAGAALAAIFLLPLIPSAPPGEEVAVPAPSEPAPSFVAELSTEGDALRLFVRYDPEAEAFRLRRLAGAPPAGRDFEFWAIPPDGVPVSLGVIGEEAVVPLPEALRDDLAALTLAVSEEEAGGSVTGAPTDVLAVAPVTEL
jgi:anti-sigma-K factor RskA